MFPKNNFSQNPFQQAAAPAFGAQQPNADVISLLAKVADLEARLAKQEGAIIVKNDGGVEIRAKNITLRADVTLELRAGMDLKLKADSKVECTSSAVMAFNCSMCTVNSSSVLINAAITNALTVKCDTLIATTVNGTTYTPGAGNVW